MSDLTSVWTEIDRRIAEAESRLSRKLLNQIAGVRRVASSGTGGSGGRSVVQDEGVTLAPRTYVNFIGAGVTAADDAANNRTNVTIPGGSGHTIQDEGVALTARAALDFAGAGVTVTDDAINGKTIVTIPGSGSAVSYFEPLTNGLVDTPELVFAAGDIIMVEVAA